MRHAVRSAVVLFSAFFAIPSFAAITGAVMNADGGAIPGAKISIYASETADARRERLTSSSPQRKALATTTSDAGGAFRIEVPKEQRFVDLRVDAAGYAPESAWSAADDEAGAIVLTKAPAKTGTITANGKPVANATVIWGGTGADVIAVTDEKGHYSVPDPSKWAQRIIVLHPDYAPLNDFMLRDTTKMSPDRTLQPGVKISGKIVNEDGTPAAGAELFVDSWPAGKSAADGTFTVAHARKDWQDLQATLGPRVAHRPHADAAVTLKLAKGATLSGTVIDAKTRQPLADAIVMLMPGGFGMPGAGETTHTAITDAKGSYTIANSVSGNFALLVDRPGYSVPRGEVALLPGRTVQKPLYATPLATVAGTVVDEDKRPVAAARVSTRAGSRESMMMMFFGRGGGRGTFSGPDGRFVARNIAEGDVIVDANKKGYPPAKTSAFRVNSGEKKSGIVLTIPRGVAFSGRVLDKNNKPVSGAAIEMAETQNNDPFGGMRRVMATFGGGRGGDDVVRSASDGTFTVRAKEGRYDVAVKADGFAGKTLRAQQVAAGMKPVDIVLEPGVEITGRVTRGGNPVENVMVATMSMSEMQSTTTGPDGTFRLGDLNPGQIMLVFNRQDAFIQEMRNVNAPAQNVNIELPPGGRITGHVVDKATHQPVTQFQAGVSTARGGGGMVIQTPPMQKSFNSDDGSFTLENVRAGSTQVVVNAPGYTAGRVPNVEVEEGKTSQDVIVELETGVKLTGKVTGPDGTPLSGVTVSQDSNQRGGRVMRFDGGMGQTVTDPNGEYTIEALEPGEKTFNYTRTGYVSESRTVTLSGKEMRSDVQMSAGLRVSGQVVTDAGAPVPDAAVRASSASDSMFGREAHTDANGGFTFEGLAPGHYSFNAQKNGYATGIARDVDVASGVPVRVTMKAGGVISGHVSGLTADELQQTTVMAFGSGTGGSASAPVDAGGNYRVEGAPTGTVRVSARVGGPMFNGSSKSSEPKTVVLEAGGSATADIEFKSSTVIRGRITRAGQPMQSASVMFFPKAGRAQTSGTTTADANGVYEISGLADGSYNVQVVDFDRLTPFATTYDVKGSGTFDIDVRVASVRGKVLDATTSQPLADARVEIRGKDSSSMNTRAALTDKDGTFVIDSVSRGSYQISADKEGFGNTMRDLQVGDTAPDVELKLSPSAGVTLRVVDGRDGRLIAAGTQVLDMQGNTVAGMGFRFNQTPEPVKLDLAPGQYRVTLNAQGYALKTIVVASPSTMTVPMTPGGTLLIQSKSTASLRARLIAPDGSSYFRLGMGDGTFPLLASPATTTLQTVAPGIYRLEVLDAGDRVVNATSVTVNEGQQTTIAI